MSPAPKPPADGEGRDFSLTPPDGDDFQLADEREAAPAEPESASHAPAGDAIDTGNRPHTGTSDPSTAPDLSTKPAGQTRNRKRLPPAGIPPAATEKDRKKLLSAIASVFSPALDPKKRRWLTAYALLGSKQAACKAVGCHFTTPYTSQWRENALFQSEMKRAEAMYGDVLEAELDRRAVEGIWKPTGWHKGEPGAWVKEHSDLLLIFRTKAVLRDKYSDRTEIRGSIAHMDMSKMTNDQLQRLSQGENVLSVMGAGLLGAAQGALPAPASAEIVVEAAKQGSEGGSEA